MVREKQNHSIFVRFCESWRKIADIVMESLHQRLLAQIAFRLIPTRMQPLTERTSETPPRKKIMDISAGTRVEGVPYDLTMTKREARQALALIKKIVRLSKREATVLSSIPTDAEVDNATVKKIAVYGSLLKRQSALLTQLETILKKM